MGLRWHKHQIDFDDLLDQGKTVEEIEEITGYGTESIMTVVKARADGDRPPGKEQGGSHGGKVVKSAVKSKGGNGAKEDTTPKAKTLAEAALVTISPKRFEMSSFFLWPAMQAAINVWGWPKDMTPQEFLDQYLVKTMLGYGIQLATYVVLPEDEPDDQENPNGSEPEDQRQYYPEEAEQWPMI